MKNKILSIILTAVLATIMVGCGSASPEDSSGQYETIEPIRAEENPVEGVNEPEEGNTIEKEKETESVNVSEEVGATEEHQVTEPEVPESADLTFADLAEWQYGFSSGAGGWSEEFTIEKDGYFTGKYHDSDMGDTGEGYADGTFYSSSYSGHFTDLTKINNHTYKMKLADISYKEPAETEEIRDNVRYIYTESYCLGGTDTFTIYLPGTPLGELPEETI